MRSVTMCSFGCCAFACALQDCAAEPAHSNAWAAFAMFLWIAIVGLALAAIALVTRHDAGTVLGFANQDFAHLVTLLALALVIGGRVFWRSKGNLAGAFRTAAAWLAIAAILVVGYTYRHDAEQVLVRVMGEIIPGRAIDVAPGEVAITRAGNGHFVIAATVNGFAIDMLFDTGATNIVLTPEAAQSCGINLSDLTYSQAVWTANGRTTAAPVLLDSVAVGQIVVTNVRAMVARPGALRDSLLGMSFLDRIQSWSVTGDRLTLKG